MSSSRSPIPSRISARSRGAESPVAARVHRVIGIDPGSVRLGIAVVERQGNTLRRIHSEVVKCGTGELAGRLSKIYQGIAAVCQAYAPTEAAIEGLFHQKNAQSALVLGHARGVAMLALAHAGLPVHEYAPALIKKAVTGRGRADKDQVASMVDLLVGKVDAASNDETDAIAIAICHLNNNTSRLPGKIR